MEMNSVLVKPPSPSLLSLPFSPIKSYDVFTNFSSLILFYSFKFSRHCFISKSFTDGDELRNILIDSSDSFPTSISPSKLSIIGFFSRVLKCVWIQFRMHFVFPKHFYVVGLSRFLKWALFYLLSVTWKSVSSCKCCPVIRK